MIVRSDLPLGVQLAQVLHAAGESAAGLPVPGTIAVALHARDEAHLREVLARCAAADLHPHEVLESADDLRYPGQLMAVGLRPTTDRAAARRVLSNLPLARDRANDPQTSRVLRAEDMVMYAYPVKHP